MPVVYSQRIYDTTAGWCYFTSATVTASPTVGETTPNHTNNLVADSHTVLKESGHTDPSGGTANFGELLFEWNKTDTTQFEGTAYRHERDLGSPSGGNANTALGLSVVSYGNPFGNVLRVTATSLQGGGYFPITSAALSSFPEKYVTYIRWADQNIGGNLFAAFYLCSINDGATFEGLSVKRAFASGTVIDTIVGGNEGSGQSFTSSGTLNTTQRDSGGIQQWIGMVRPDGDTPSYSRAWLTERGGASNDQPWSQYLLHTISGVSTNWDGVDMTRRPGPGAYEAINGSTGHIDYADVKIYAYPDD